MAASGVAAARDREGRRRGDGARPASRVPSANGVELEHAHRAVPHDRAGVAQLRRKLRHRSAGRCPESGRRRQRRSSGLDGSRAHRQRRSWRRPRPLASAPCRAKIPRIAALASANQVGLGQRSCRSSAAGREDEGVGDAAADDQRVDLRGERLQDRQLGGDLGARRRWPPAGASGCASALSMRVELGRQQRACAGDRRIPGDAVGRRFGAMRGAEGIVDIDVAQRGHFPARAQASFFFSPTFIVQFSSRTTSRLRSVPGPPSTQSRISGTSCPARRRGGWLSARANPGRSIDLRRDAPGGM